MQLTCHHCRGIMTVPDQAAHFGGMFTCPACRAVNTFAPIAGPGYSMPGPGYAMSRPGHVMPGPHRATSATRRKDSNPLQAVAGVAIVGVLFSMCAVSSWVAKRREEAEAAELASQNAERAEKQRQERAAEEARKAAELAEAQAKLVADAGSQAKRASEAIAKGKAKISEGEWAAARESLASASKILAQYDALDPVPQEIATLSKPLAETNKSLERITTVVDAVEALDTDGQRLARLVSEKSWEDAERTAKHALQQIDALESADEDLQAHIPGSLNLKKERRGLEGQLKKVTKKANKIREKRREAEVYAALCGHRPERSAWDGEYIEVESALRLVAHDPDSIDVENCTPASLTADNCWVTECQVRGRNAFGAKVLDVKRFSISKLGVSEL